jgi:hypothetical protein
MGTTASTGTIQADPCDRRLRAALVTPGQHGPRALPADPGPNGRPARVCRCTARAEAEGVLTRAGGVQNRRAARKQSSELSEFTAYSRRKGT